MGLWNNFMHTDTWNFPPRNIGCTAVFGYTLPTSVSAFSWHGDSRKRNTQLRYFRIRTRR